MQERTFTRLCLLLERVEPGSTKRLVDAIRSERAVRETMRILRQSDWAELPDGMELAAIEQRLDDWSRHQLDSFEGWAIEQGHNEWRVLVSRQRILAPLACHARTCGVERGWDELGKQEKRDFIRWGIARERILLRVAPAYVRAIARFPVGDTGHDQDLKFVMEALDIPDTEENRRNLERRWTWGGVW